MYKYYPRYIIIIVRERVKEQVADRSDFFTITGQENFGAGGFSL
jgi:hypothetical protein